MPTMFVNGGPNCCCCDDLFIRGPGLGVDTNQLLSGVTVWYVSRNSTNKWDTKLELTGLVPGGPAAVDQINKLYALHRPGGGFAVRIGISDVQAGMDGYNPTPPPPTVNPFTQLYTKANSGGTVFSVRSLALDKRSKVIYWIEKATLSGSSTFTLYSLPYTGGTPSTVLTLSGSTVDTGYSLWHPPTLSLYAVVKDATTCYIKQITALGETTLYSVARSTSEHIHCLELDLQRGQMWWIERNLSITNPSSIDTVKRSDIFGAGAITLYITPARTYIDALKKSYKHDCIFFAKGRNDIPMAQDVGSGLFKTDYQMENLELIFDRALSINQGPGTVHLQVVTPWELYCGYENTGESYQGC